MSTFIHGRDREQVYLIYNQIAEAIQKAEAGEITFAQVFDQIAFSSFLPSNTVLSTTWHIDDIRDRFPVGTSNERLFKALQGIESGLRDTAVQNGWEVIGDSIGGVLDEMCDWCEEREGKEACGHCGFRVCYRCRTSSSLCQNCGTGTVSYSAQC